MSLAPHVRALGRGPGRSRHLTEDEAREAMGAILSGRVAPEAVGALLMLMRYRGESPAEVAGLARGLRDALPPWPGPAPDIDWPSYAAGRSRGLPLFLLSARLAAAAGLRVLIHGWNGDGPAGSDAMRSALPLAGVPEAASPDDAAGLLDRGGIAYLPLERLSPEALRLVRLRAVLGLRSPVNTVLRALNPGAARASVQGVFHPPFLALQAEAAALLGQPSLTVVKGGGGEFERHPTKDLDLHGLREGRPWRATAPALAEGVRRLADAEPDPGRLPRLWSGKDDEPFALSVVLGTAALALETAGAVPEGAGLALARDLWSAHRAVAAA